MHLSTDTEARGLVTMLLKMRRNPELYIGKKDIQHLMLYINGYTYATFELGWVFPQDLLFEEFNEWYLKRHRAKDFHSALVCIHYKHLKDPAGAVDIYFQAWDKFWEMKTAKMSEQDILAMLTQPPDTTSFPPILYI